LLTMSKIFRTTGRINKSKGLILAEPMPLEEGMSVDVMIIPTAPDDGDISEAEWLSAAARNPVFADWNDPEEDIYSPDEGVPFDEHRYSHY